MSVELFDWILNENCIRGSKIDDLGIWVNNSAKPLRFCPTTRTIELKDGTKYIIKQKTICKAIGLDKKSEKVLNSLPIIL